MNIFQCLAVSFLCGVMEFEQVFAKDYYKTLGVTKKATEKEIKKAFRALALVYHPDKSSEPDALDKFREIAEAYEVLSDPDKRRQYDQIGHSKFSESSDYKPGDYDDIFKDFDDLFKDMGHGNHNQHFKHHFGAHKFHHDQATGAGDFQFGQDIKFEELFDSPFLNFHDFEDMGDFQVNPTGHKRRTKNRKRAATAGHQSCRTVTQKVGNTVTTYTQCS
jgi:DnaJ family protein B protein 9